ncbi:MAG TPA: preprotein translocase subunit YajC [Acidimicrobiales bacterium]|nr:preprotein translocase subunit YajC [Acidimicrobiales bacterium]
MAALLPILLLVVLMYFLLIRPQQRRMRQQQALMSAVAEGDEVVTSAGMYGFITAMEGDVVWVEIAEGVEVRLAKGAIARRVTPAADAHAPEPPHADDTDDTAADEPEADGGTGSTGGDGAARGSDDET